MVSNANPRAGTRPPTADRLVVPSLPTGPGPVRGAPASRARRSSRRSAAGLTPLRSHSDSLRQRHSIPSGSSSRRPGPPASRGRADPAESRHSRVVTRQANDHASHRASRTDQLPCLCSIPAIPPSEGAYCRGGRPQTTYRPSNARECTEPPVFRASLSEGAHIAEKGSSKNEHQAGPDDNNF